MPPCGNLRLQSEPDLLLLRSYCCKDSWSFTIVVFGVRRKQTVCVCTSQLPTSALFVLSLEQFLNAMFSSIATMSVPLQSQHLHIPQDQWYGQGCNRSNCLLQIISGKSHCNSRRMDWGTGIEKIDLIYKRRRKISWHSKERRWQDDDDDDNKNDCSLCKTRKRWFKVY